jgi:type I restriction enzyme S subunit
MNRLEESLPSGWSYPKIKDVIKKFQNGYAFSATGYVNSGIPIITMGSIQLDGNFKKDNKKIKYWEENTREELSRYIIKKESLIMAMTDVTPTMELIGRSCIVKGEGEFYLNQRVGWIDTDESKVSKDFLSYLTNYADWRKYCITSSGLAAQANLSTVQILEGRVKLPPIAQQQKIAKILSTVDNLIEKTQTLIDKYTAIKQGMMADLFTRRIDMTTGDTSKSKGGKLRPSVEDAPELYKQTQLGWVPKEWEVCSFGDALEYGYLTLIQDGNHGETYPRSSDFEITGVPFLSAKHIDQFGMINLDKCPKLPESYLTKLRIGFGRKGDVIFAHNATVGPVGIIDTVDSFIASTSTTIHRTGEGVSNIFLFNYMQSIIFQDQVTRVMGQTTRNQVPIGAQKELYLVKPSTAEQADISDALINISKSLKLETELLGKYKLQKKGLMQDLLTGKVRVF